MPHPETGSGSENPWMPCLYGRFPVAIEVQSIGERIGCNVAICPLTPNSMNFSKDGHFPRFDERMNDVPVGRIPAQEQYAFRQALGHESKFSIRRKKNPGIFTEMPG